MLSKIREEKRQYSFVLNFNESLELLISIVYYYYYYYTTYNNNQQRVGSGQSCVRYLFLTLLDPRWHRPDQTFNFQLLYTALPFLIYPATI